MLYVTYALNGILMIAIPVALGIFLTRKFQLGWRLFWIGAATFVISQVVHIPLNFGLTTLFEADILPAPPEAYQLIFNAIVLGLTAGLCEEIARYTVYRWWIPSARTWSQGVLFGAGHGGIESIILGVFVLFAFVQMIVLSNMDLATVIPPEQLDLAQEQLTAYWSAPWYITLMGALERVFALCLQMSLAVMVLQVFTRKNMLWLLAAIGWHALVNAIAVYSLQSWGIFVTEGLLAVCAGVSLFILFSLRTSQPEPVSAETEP